MQSKAIFCYEFNQGNQPYPVLYPDGLPPRLVGKPVKREMITVVIDPDATIDQLMRVIPHPKLLHKETINVKKEYQMPRPVEGFLTSTGHFFDTAAEADLFEARYELDIASTEAVEAMTEYLAKEGAGIDIPTYLIQALPTFIEQNEQVILDLINARRAIAKAGPPSMAGQATETDQVDDTRVRDSDNSEVVTAPDAEDKPPTAGTKATGKKGQPTDITDL